MDNPREYDSNETAARTDPVEDRIRGLDPRYKEDLIELSRDLMRGNSIRQQHAITSIGQICWIGGESAQTYIINWTHGDDALGLNGKSIAQVLVQMLKSDVEEETLLVFLSIMLL